MSVAALLAVTPRPDEFRYRCRNGGQYLPLRHLRAHPRSDQARRKRTSDVGGRVMSLIENSLIGRHSIENLTRTVSRRGLLKAGLAAGFTLAFHLPLRAGDEVEQSANNKDKFAPNAFIRIDRSARRRSSCRKWRWGKACTRRYLRSSPRSSTQTMRRSHSLTRRPATSFTAIRFLAFRPPAIPIRSALSGSRFALPARQPERCWCRRPRTQWQVDPTSCSASDGTVSSPSQRPHLGLWRPGGRSGSTAGGHWLRSQGSGKISC